MALQPRQFDDHLVENIATAIAEIGSIEEMVREFIASVQNPDQTTAHNATTMQTQPRQTTATQGTAPVQSGAHQQIKPQQTTTSNTQQVGQLHLDQSGADYIKQVEESGKVKLRVYDDGAGFGTIGWGHKIVPGDGLKAGDTITSAQADEFFRRDVRDAEQIVARYVKVPLTQNQYNALISMSFNLGEGGFRNEDGSSTQLLRELNAGHYDKVPAQIMRFVNANGRRMEGLVNRRQADVNLWNKGGGTPQSVQPANSTTSTTSANSNAMLRSGDSGQNVKVLQTALNKQGASLEVDGKFGPQTQAAVEQFQAQHNLSTDGIAGQQTMAALQNIKPQQTQTTPDAPGGTAGIADQAAYKNAQGQMSRLLQYARSHVPGGVGYCYRSVSDYLDAVGYGNMKPGTFDAHLDGYTGLARNFAEYMNKGDNAAKNGLVRLSITNPYDAPPGAIVVVEAGSPGTSYSWERNKYAGDISVAAGNGQFINDHANQGYGGSRQNFANAVGASNPGHAKVLGVYVPKGYVYKGRQY